MTIHLYLFALSLIALGLLARLSYVTRKYAALRRKHRNDVQRFFETLGA